jgi:hypothetical protein
MVRCLSAFIEACYIARRNAISTPLLKRLQQNVEKFHSLRDIFIETGVRSSISLPRQHALSHYAMMIPFFASPNGVCSSITESKHIKAVKEPWRRSNRYNALSQMLHTIVRMEKLSELRNKLERDGMLNGSLADATSPVFLEHDNRSNMSDSSLPDLESELDSDDLKTDDAEDDDSPEETPVSDGVDDHDGDTDLESVEDGHEFLNGAQSVVKLAKRIRKFLNTGCSIGVWISTNRSFRIWLPSTCG